MSTSSGTPLDLHHAAQRVRMRVGGQFLGTGRADIGQQAPAARGGPDEPRVRQHQQRIRRRQRRPQGGDELDADRVAVVEQRNPPVRG